MNNRILGLGELEEDIMDVLWRRKQGTVREVLELLQRKRTLAYTTVMTVMARLADKGLLRREALPDGSFLYIPTTTKETWAARHSRGLFEALLQKTGTLAVAQFVDVLEEKDQEALAKLKSLLRKRTKEGAHEPYSAQCLPRSRSSI